MSVQLLRDCCCVCIACQTTGPAVLTLADVARCWDCIPGEIILPNPAVQGAGLWSMTGALAGTWNLPYTGTSSVCRYSLEVTPFTDIVLHNHGQNDPGDCSDPIVVSTDTLLLSLLRLSGPSTKWGLSARILGKDVNGKTFGGVLFERGSMTLAGNFCGALSVSNNTTCVNLMSDTQDAGTDSHIGTGGTADITVPKNP